MRIALVAAFVGTVFLGASGPAAAKSETVGIEIAGGSLSAPLEIRDPRIVSAFNIWNGPGVSVNGQAVHLDPAHQVGMFIDWPKGMARNRPAGLQQYTVTFHLEVDQRRHGARHSKYVVLYAFDPSTREGYIYLPGSKDSDPPMNQAIWHGVEGNWFRSSNAWEKLVRPLVVRELSAMN